jgi:shikimate dehydrogenase
LFGLCRRTPAAYIFCVSQSGQPATNAATRLCAVYGFPIAHSASPAMHNAAFAHLGLNWRYLAFEVDPKNLRAAIEGARAMNFAGLNLTVPHKMMAVEMVDELDDSAKTFGAVNTIRFEARGAKSEMRGARQTRVVGFNTDAQAMVTALRKDLNMKVRGAKVLLLGAGGAGRTAALRLAMEDAAELFLVNRTGRKAVELAEEVKRKFPSATVSVGYPKTTVDLLLNATSVGLKADDGLPFDERKFPMRQARAVYDMIYRPAETKLLAVAKRAGCDTANGLGMLLHQGAKAFEIWTGRRAPVEIMRKALEKHIYGH